MTDLDDQADWRTTLSPDDVSTGKRLDGSENKQDYYKRLAVANTLDWNGKWVEEERITEKSERGIFDSMAARLELTDFQKERGWGWYKQLPDHFRTAYRMEMVLLVVCGLTGEKDGRNYHPNNLRADDPNEFGELANRIDISYKQFYKCWDRIEAMVA